ncbi:Hsp70 family protein [Bacteroides acidifaciens]|uniref:Hsp70 family protein n=1 Tax=Bacteroides acidifaciens TaxID=85831 RepID=UPI00262DFF74|nr:hypothetical protein [Bacteroides acidifaciens]
MKEVTPNTEFVIGIDFGHGETSAAFYSLSGSEDKFDLDILPGQKVIKSAVAIMDQEGVPTICVGDAAIANAPMAKVFQVSFKKRPSEMSSSERNLMVAFMKGVYAGIIEQHPDYKTREHVVYIARPSQDDLWKSEETAYLQIAEDAGLPVAGIQKESRAAYFRARTQPDSKIDQEVKKGVLIVDFGSSTIDFTYLNQSLTSPIDGGCPLGASQVEKSLMEYAFAHPIIQDDAMQQFAQAYGLDENSKPYNRLIFEFRKKKEEYYKNKLSSFSLVFDLHDLTSSENEQIPFGKFGCVNITKLQIDEILGKNTPGGYIENVKNAVVAFKDENLRDCQVACVYLTGGASRMDFVREIFMEVFALDAEHCPLDEYPERIVSQGVAHLSYADIKTIETEEALKNKVKQLIDNFNWDYEIRKILGREIMFRIQKEAAEIMSHWVHGSIYQTVYIDGFFDKARYRTTESGSTRIHNLYSLAKEFDRVFNSFLYQDFAKGCEEKINSEILGKVIVQLNVALTAYKYKPLQQRLSINEISAKIKQSGVNKLSYRFIGEGNGHILYDAVAKLCKGAMVDWNTEKDRLMPFRMNHRNYFTEYYSGIFTSYQWDEFISKDIELSGVTQAKAVTLEYANKLVEEYISYAKLAKFFN